MPNFLFWNVDDRRLSKLIGDICEEHAVDCFALAECSEHTVSILHAVNRRSPYFKEVFPYNTKIRVFTSLPTRCIAPVRDDGGISVRRVRTPMAEDLTLVLVHLSSKLRKDKDSQAQHCSRLRALIRQVESRVGHSKTVVMGDFNMDPFEAGMVSSEGLHGVMSRRFAESEGRKVGGKSRGFFYNPMWGHMGDRSPGPPGTYFYYNSNEVSYFWHTFDQVLIRPSLLPVFGDDGVAVLTAAGSQSLLRDDGRPNRADFTDHLPILLRLRGDAELL